jgi:hypothetical protein
LWNYNLIKLDSMASKYLQKYPVPQGFPEILHDFTKEILRDQPENIKEFGYQYFKALEEVSTLLLLLLPSIIYETLWITLLCRECHLSTKGRARPSLHPRIGSLSTRTTDTSHPLKTPLRLRPSPGSTTHDTNRDNKFNMKNLILLTK